MISWSDKPIPVIVEGNKEGYLLYVESSGGLENDIWTVVHCDAGIVRHYLTSDIRIHYNATLGINKNTNQNG